MKLISYVQNVFIGIALCIFTCYSTHCQTQKSSLFVHYELDSVLKDAVHKSKRDEIKILIANTGKSPDPNMKHFDIPSSVTGVELDLPDGMYDIGFLITTSYELKGMENFEFSEFIYDSTFRRISVSKSTPKRLNLFLKNRCPFRRDATNNVCPKCRSAIKVIPVCKGLPIGDIECHFDEKYSGCSSQSCAPIWYCKTDKLEF